MYRSHVTYANQYLCVFSHLVYLVRDTSTNTAETVQILTMYLPSAAKGPNAFDYHAVKRLRKPSAVLR